MRLPYSTFSIPLPEIRRGYYSAVYFWREKRILEQKNIKSRVLIQIFNKIDNAVICGIDESLSVLRLGTGHWKNYQKMYPIFDNYIKIKLSLRKANIQNNYNEIQNLNSYICELHHKLNSLWVSTYEDLKIKAVYDGNKSLAYKAILTIEGQASEFAHLESVYLGILARGSKIATNTSKVVEAAKGKEVLFFADRYDRWHNQVADGYAAMKSGAYGVTTDAMGAWWGMSGFGTIPHALIAIYNGNTSKATLDFNECYPNVKSIALVDFHNNCVKTSLEVAKEFKKRNKKLWGVRLDTSQNMVDQSVISQMGQFIPTGVCAPLVNNVRKALDKEGFDNVKIVVSGGFNSKRIKNFEKNNVLVDVYGIGSSLLNDSCYHTADIVKVEGKYMAKKGRIYQPSENLKNFDWSEIEP